MKGPLHRLNSGSFHQINTVGISLYCRWRVHKLFPTNNYLWVSGLRLNFTIIELWIKWKWLTFVCKWVRELVSLWKNMSNLKSTSSNNVTSNCKITTQRYLCLGMWLCIFTLAKLWPRACTYVPGINNLLAFIFMGLLYPQVLEIHINIPTIQMSRGNKW